jgi:hypothetical protein
MMPTNSRKFKSRDFAIRFRISARSVCFPLPLLEVGVMGGVYSCWIPCSSRLGNGSFIYHRHKSALQSSSYQDSDSIDVIPGMLTLYRSPKHR